jgi:ABC-2 type transport system permease protein
VTRLFSVEFFKLRKRLMTWVLALILVGLVVLLYSILWNVSGEASARLDFARRFTPQDLRRALFVQFAVPFSLQLVGTFGIVLAVIYAAGAAGGEYGWGTVRLMATSANGRVRLITAKLLIVCLMIVLGALVAVAVGVAYSWLITTTSGGSDYSFVTWSFLWQQLEAFGRTLFVLSPYVAMAFCIAVVGRSTLAGVGAGLGVALIGPLVASLMNQAGTPWKSMPQYFLHTNSQIIMAQNAVPQPLPQFGPSLRELAREGARPPEEAALILLVYVVVFVVATMVVFRRRDITAN